MAELDLRLEMLIEHKGSAKIKSLIEALHAGRRKRIQVKLYADGTYVLTHPDGRIEAIRR